MAGAVLTSRLAVAVSLSLVVTTRCAAIRTWKTIYMDEDVLCNVVIHNDDMAHGDLYAVESDQWDGRSPHDRRPAECWTAFDFGVRFVAVTVKEWRCDEAYTEPFLAVYDNCAGDRLALLGQLNCSLQKPQTIYSSSSCLSLYHFRGHRKGGYFFSLEVVALHEIIAFPVGGIAAFIFVLFVLIMLVVKAVCVISGYERRLPELNLEPGEEQQILDSVVSIDTKPPPAPDMPNISHVNNGADQAAQQAAAMPAEHRNLVISQSIDSATSSDLDYDFLDIPISGNNPPRLKRYPSAKASSIWGH